MYYKIICTWYMKGYRLHVVYLSTRWRRIFSSSPAAILRCKVLRYLLDRRRWLHDHGARQVFRGKVTYPYIAGQGVNFAKRVYLLGYDVTSLGIWFPVFRDKKRQGLFSYILTLERRDPRSSPRRTDTPATPLWKPKTSQLIFQFISYASFTHFWTQLWH